MEQRLELDYGKILTTGFVLIVTFIAFYAYFFYQSPTDRARNACLNSGKVWIDNGFIDGNKVEGCVTEPPK